MTLNMVLPTAPRKGRRDAAGGRFNQPTESHSPHILFSFFLFEDAKMSTLYEKHFCNLGPLNIPRAHCE